MAAADGVVFVDRVDKNGAPMPEPEWKTRFRAILPPRVHAAPADGEFPVSAHAGYIIHLVGKDAPEDPTAAMILTMKIMLAIHEFMWAVVGANLEGVDETGSNTLLTIMITSYHTLMTRTEGMIASSEVLGVMSAEEAENIYTATVEAIRKEYPDDTNEFNWITVCRDFYHYNTAVIARNRLAGTPKHAEYAKIASDCHARMIFLLKSVASIELVEQE
jgi:hypothetical protein